MVLPVQCSGKDKEIEQTDVVLTSDPQKCGMLCEGDRVKKTCTIGRYPKKLRKTQVARTRGRSVPQNEIEIE